MNRFSSERDITGRSPATSPGVPGRRMCWGCNQGRAELGGRKHPRNKQWHCAGCAEKWGKRPETT